MKSFNEWAAEKINEGAGKWQDELAAARKRKADDDEMNKKGKHSGISPNDIPGLLRAAGARKRKLQQKKAD